MKRPRDILLEKARQYRLNLETYTGRVQVSKTQLKRFKITTSNRDIWEALNAASGNWMQCLDVERIIVELTNQELLFKAIRYRRQL